MPSSPKSQQLELKKYIYTQNIQQKELSSKLLNKSHTKSGKSNSKIN